MPELRKDPITDRWVVFSEERSKRPSDFPKTKPETILEHDKSCPFCYGNEDKTPPEVTAIRLNNSQPNTTGWLVRVVPNKFPALSLEEFDALQKNPQSNSNNTENNNSKVDKSDRDKLYLSIPAYGAHEVIIESPKHNTTLSSHSKTQLTMIWETIRNRYVEHKSNSNLKYVQVFKNHGHVAGASLMHTHFQVISTPNVPSTVAAELAYSLEYFIDTGKCIHCQIIHNELERSLRIIHETKDFVAFCPFASRFPFEISIMPKKHSSSFTNLSNTEIDDLSSLTKTVFTRLDNALTDPPFNLVIHSTPQNLKAEEYYHWHIEIVPRLTKIAGFEFGTGYYINPTTPENAAKFLNHKEGN